MTNHHFGIMQIPPEHGKRYDDFEPEKYNCISVNDNHIEVIAEKLTDIDFYWHTLDVEAKGIAYCGVSLIPPSSMQQFISIIDNIPELQELKQLLSKAHKDNMWIIHFGL